MNKAPILRQLCTILLVFAFVLPLVVVGFGCKNDDSTAPGVTTITVSGFVKDYDGEPISGVVVIIRGSTPVTTAGDGSFSVANVTAPYDLSVVLGTQNTVVIFKGLTRSDPTLSYSVSLATLKTATITGTVPGAAGKTTIVFFVSGTKAWRVTANQATGDFTINATWYGSTGSYVGKLYVLRWTLGPNNLPLVYDAYGERALTISSGGTFANNNFVVGDLTDPAEQSISGTINRPTTAYTLTGKQFYLNIGSAYVVVAGESGTLTDNFSYNVPSIAGALFGVNTFATLTTTPTNRLAFAYDAGITPGTSNEVVNLLTAPQANLPAHNGTGIDTSTAFLWTAGGGTGIYLISIAPTAGVHPAYLIYTQSTTVTIPNYSAQGLGLPANTPYQWQLVQYYPVASVDAVASPTFLSLFRGNQGDYGFGISEIFAFTTKP